MVIFPHFFCFQIPKSSPGAKQLARIRLRSSQRRAGAALCDGSPRSAQEPRCRPNTEPSEPRGRRGWVIDGLSMFIPWFTGFQPSWCRIFAHKYGYSRYSIMFVNDDSNWQYPCFYKTFFGGVYKSVCHVWEVQSRMRARCGVIAREPNNDQSWTANSTNPHYSRPQLNIFHCQFPGCIGFWLCLEEPSKIKQQFYRFRISQQVDYSSFKQQESRRQISVSFVQGMLPPMCQDVATSFFSGSQKKNLQSVDDMFLKWGLPAS